MNVIEILEDLIISYLYGNNAVLEAYQMQTINIVATVLAIVGIVWLVNALLKLFNLK